MSRSTTARARSHPRVTRIFLFTDLRDYTRFVETNGDVAASRLLRDYRTIVRREVAKTRGAEIKTEGDSFYIVFEAAVPALECAVAVLQQVEAHNERHPDRALRIGAGLHAGDAVEYDDQYVGGAVIVASRLSTKAAAGELLVSDTFRGLVRTAHAHVLRDRGVVTLKGVSEPIHVWSAVTGASSPAPEPTGAAVPRGSLQQPVATGQIVCPVLIGRGEELTTFRDLLTRAAAGSGRVLFVNGEPGVGKSAFVRDAARAAVELGFGLLPGAAVQWERGLPYGPFLSALRAGFPGQALREIVTSIAPDLGPLFPELGQAGAAADSPLERHRIARAFGQLLAAAAAQAPVLVVLEDMHWVDEASIALLQQLARSVAQQRVIVLATYRSDEVHRRHPLAPLVSELVRAGLGDLTTLGLLDAHQTRHLVEATLGDLPLEPELVEAIFARSEGNPFFTEELLRSLVTSGAIVHHGGAGWERTGRAQLRLPDTLRDLMLARLERLSPSARTTLAAASVIGGRFDYGTLRTVRAIEEAALIADLREAVDEQLLVEQRESGAPTFAFRHALGREAIYDDLLLPERQRLHLRVAETLAAAERTPPALVAQHWSAGGDRRRAAEAYERAGNAALSLNAASEAVAHFEAAITASDTATPAQYLGLARAYMATDHLKARSAAERGLEALRDASDVATRVALMRIAGQARWLMGDAAGNLELARTAVELVEGADDSPAKADTFEWYASALAAGGDVASAREWAERALAVARASGAREVAANALITIASCEATRSPVAALALVDEAAAIARGATAAQALGRAHTNGLVFSFQSEPARRRFVRFERAAEFGQRYGHGARQIASLNAYHRFVAGDWPASGEFGVAGDADADMYVALVRLTEAFIACARDGTSPAAVSRLGASVARAVRQDEPQWTVPWLAYAALVHAWSGDREAFRAAVVSMLAAADLTADPARSLTLLARGFTAPATVLLLAGERERLAAMAKALVDVDGHAGERELILAFGAWLDGDPIEAFFDAGAAALSQRGFPLSTALAVWGLGATRPDAQLPAAALAAAMATLRTAGATWLADALAAREVV
ncbi:MAG TPA: AAA family ATPase [Candidatus Limnocylindria bacterium]|nr:AAA family ATPase [Candidatus Limnocylindria bacterium]